MTHPLQSMIDAPLANATKINLPLGRRSAPRTKPADLGDDIGCPRLTSKELGALKKKAAEAKLSALFDYYATTDIDPSMIAKLMGLYRKQQTGTDMVGKPTFERVLDVERAEQQISYRRKQVA